MPNPLDNLRMPKAGDPTISATLIATIVEQVKASLNLEGIGSVTGPYGASVTPKSGAPDPIYARITAASSTAGFFEWEQVRPNLADAAWEVPAMGLTYRNFGELFIPDHLTGAFAAAAVPGAIYQVFTVIAENGSLQRIGAAVGSLGKLDGILGTATNIAPNRWSYPFSVSKYDHTGVYTTVTGGLTGTAYNKIESGNTATGVQGCGINADNLPTGWSIQPIGAGADVEITPVVNCDDGSIEYVFQAVNNADGVCP